MGHSFGGDNVVGFERRQEKQGKGSLPAFPADRVGRDQRNQDPDPEKKGAMQPREKLSADSGSEAQDS